MSHSLSWSWTGTSGALNPSVKEIDEDTLHFVKAQTASNLLAVQLASEQQTSSKRRVNQGLRVGLVSSCSAPGTGIVCPSHPSQKPILSHPSPVVIQDPSPTPTPPSLPSPSLAVTYQHPWHSPARFSDASTHPSALKSDLLTMSPQRSSRQEPACLPGREQAERARGWKIQSAGDCVSLQAIHKK